MAAGTSERRDEKALATRAGHRACMGERPVTRPGRGCSSPPSLSSRLTKKDGATCHRLQPRGSVGCDPLPRAAHGKEGVERAADGQQTCRAASRSDAESTRRPPLGNSLDIRRSRFQRGAVRDYAHGPVREPAVVLRTNWRVRQRVCRARAREYHIWRASASSTVCAREIMD